VRFNIGSQVTVFAAGTEAKLSIDINAAIRGMTAAASAVAMAS
jgi:hypothetical protein